VHADFFDQLSDRALSVSNGIKEPTTGRVGEHVEHRGD
jgi:hypothetical protein